MNKFVRFSRVSISMLRYLCIFFTKVRVLQKELAFYIHWIRHGREIENVPLRTFWINLLIVQSQDLQFRFPVYSNSVEGSKEREERVIYQNFYIRDIALANKLQKLKCLEGRQKYTWLSHNVLPLHGLYRERINYITSGPWQILFSMQYARWQIWFSSLPNRCSQNYSCLT